MKKYSNKITAALLAVMMLGTAAGCAKSTSETAPVETATPEATVDTEVANQPKEDDGQVTIESLVEGVRAKASTAEGMKYHNNIQMGMEISVLGEKVTSEVTGEGISESDGKNTHSKTTLTSVSEGETTTEETEVYYIADGDKFVKYELTEGKWYKSTEDAGGGVDFTKMTDFDFSTATLETSDTEYVIVASLAYDDVNDNIETGGTAAVPEETSENEDVRVPVEFHFDKETKDLKSIFIDMGVPLGEYMKQAAQEAFAERMKEEGVEDTADLSSLFSMDITKFTINMYDFDYEKHVIELPEEAKNAIEKVEEDTVANTNTAETTTTSGTN